MAISSPSSLLDTLYCFEEQDHHPWEDNGDVYVDGDEGQVISHTTHEIDPLFLLDQQDLLWEDEELVSLFTKEQQQHKQIANSCVFLSNQTDPSLLVARKEAVDWILKVKSHYGFTHLTAILSINYLDRFLSSLHFQKDKPWMIQLVAVTCLSLAAKVEETQVPLLLDLQVEDTKYLFEAKNIQKMELLVMSTLKWRMNPVTPISFLDHIVRRLGLKNHLHWDFFKKCEALILSLVSDSRFVLYRPSVLASAVMLHVIDQLDPSNSIDYQNQLLDVLKTTKEKVQECYDMVVEISKACFSNNYSKKRKINEGDEADYEHDNDDNNSMDPGSPVGVMDVHFSCDENSNDSWKSMGSPPIPSSFDHHHHHHHHHNLFKKRKISHHHQQQQQQLGFGSFSCRMFVDVTASPR